MVTDARCNGLETSGRWKEEASKRISMQFWIGCPVLLSWGEILRLRLKLEPW
jgi:hypothetical protein